MTFSIFVVAACVPSADDLRAKSRDDAPGIALPDGEALPEINPADCPGGAPTLVDGWPAYWSVLHFSAADNDLESALIGDINEMELGHQGTDNVNVLVQIDYHSEDGTERFRVTPDSDMDTLGSEVVGWTNQESNSGDWHTLASFGQWAATCYPAENYMVIIGGHGGGWSAADEARGADAARIARARRNALDEGESFRMIAPDDSDGTEMTIRDLQKALDVIQKATVREGDRPDWNRLMIYGSDACLMQTAEVDYDLRNEVRYIIGSEETEPGAGWPYNTIIRELTTRPSHYWESPHELVEEIVTFYGQSYNQGSAGDDEYTTLAAVDVRDMIKVRNRMEDVSDALIALLEKEDAEQGASGYTLEDHLWQSREGSYSFNDEYTDLGLFLVTLRAALVDDGLMPALGEHWDGDENWRDLRDAVDELTREPDAYTADSNGLLNDSIVRSANGPGYPNAWGVSVYFPFESSSWGLSVEHYGALNDFGIDSRWAEVLHTLFNGDQDPDDPIDDEDDHDPQFLYGELALDLQVGAELAYTGVSGKCDYESRGQGHRLSFDAEYWIDGADDSYIFVEVDVDGDEADFRDVYVTIDPGAVDLGKGDAPAQAQDLTADDENRVYTGVASVVLDNGEQSFPVEFSWRCDGFES